MQATVEKSFLEAVESYFVTRVGRGLALSGMDIHRLRQWQSRSVPAEVIMRGLERALHFWKKEEPPRSLAFASRHVEEAIEKYRDSRPGVATEAPAWTRPASSDYDLLRSSLARLARRDLSPRARRALHAGSRALRQLERAPRPVAAVTAWDAVRERAVEHLVSTLSTEERAEIMAATFPRSQRTSGGAVVSGFDTMSPEAAEAHRKARFTRQLLETFKLGSLLRTPRATSGP